MRLALHARHGPALSLLGAIFLVAAGVLAGVLGTAGGITSLVSYPVLLAVGLPPLSANATNIVALSACWPGAAHGSRQELRGASAQLRRWLPGCVAGGATGAVLLLITPAGAFSQIVPILIVAGAALLIVEPWITGLRLTHALRGGRLQPALVVLALSLIAVYGGYFGAGAGVMSLALLLVLVERDLPTANALKNMTNGAMTLPASIILAALGPVHWGAVAALAPGLLIGARIGPAVTRALPRAMTRWGVALLGFGLATWLWARPSR